jgi:xanthine dehydrogenase accessory factor
MTPPVASPFENILVVIKGAGDLASGVAYRLKQTGFPIVMTELPAPLMVRRTVSFGEAVFAGQTTVEGVSARRVDSAAEARALAAGDAIPILVDPQAAAVGELEPVVLVDAIMAKRNTGTRLTDAPLVIALGPGFQAGHDCHAVIETMRGHWLGRIVSVGPAQPDTKTPGTVGGRTADRVLRAPAVGRVEPAANIGQRLASGDLIASVAGHEVRAPFAGVLRGLVHPQVNVEPGLKIGDLDPRADQRHCFTISDKSLAVAGGVLTAILSHDVVRAYMRARVVSK